VLFFSLLPALLLSLLLHTTALLAKSASLAVDNGQTQPFASTMADAFSVAKQESIVPHCTGR
jgi:hypothetical protein